MPIIESWKNNGLYRRYSGNVSFPEFLEGRKRVYGDPRLDDIRFQLGDFSAVESYTASVEDIVKLAHLDAAAARSREGMCIAIVATRPDMLQLAYLYAAESAAISSWHVSVFKSVADAEQWLSSCLMRFGNHLQNAGACA